MDWSVQIAGQTTHTTPDRHKMMLQLQQQHLLVLLLALVAEVNASVPWHSFPKNVKQEELYRGLPPTVFASNGRLYNVEAMMEAASSPNDASSNLVVAILCQAQKDDDDEEEDDEEEEEEEEEEEREEEEREEEDDEEEDEDSTAVVVVSTYPKSPHVSEQLLNHHTTTAETTKKWGGILAPKLFGITAGNAIDSLLLHEKLQQITTKLWQDQDPNVLGITTTTTALPPPSLVARQLADHLQRPTQSIAEGKILAVSYICISLFVCVFAPQQPHKNKTTTTRHNFCLQFLFWEGWKRPNDISSVILLRCSRSHPTFFGFSCHHH